MPSIFQCLRPKGFFGILLLIVGYMCFHAVYMYYYLLEDESQKFVDPEQFHSLPHSLQRGMILTAKNLEPEELAPDWWVQHPPKDDLTLTNTGLIVMIVGCSGSETKIENAVPKNANNAASTDRVNGDHTPESIEVALLNMKRDMRRGVRDFFDCPTCTGLSDDLRFMKLAARSGWSVAVVGPKVACPIAGTTATKVDDQAGTEGEASPSFESLLSLTIEHVETRWKEAKASRGPTCKSRSCVTPSEEADVSEHPEVMTKPPSKPDLHIVLFLEGWPTRWKAAGSDDTAANGSTANPNTDNLIIGSRPSQKKMFRCALLLVEEANADFNTMDKSITREEFDKFLRDNKSLIPTTTVTELSWMKRGEQTRIANLKTLLDEFMKRSGAGEEIRKIQILIDHQRVFSEEVFPSELIGVDGKLMMSSRKVEQMDDWINEHTPAEVADIVRKLCTYMRSDGAEADVIEAKFLKKLWDALYTQAGIETQVKKPQIKISFVSHNPTQDQYFDTKMSWQGKSVLLYQERGTVSALLLSERIPNLSPSTADEIYEIMERFEHAEKNDLDRRNYDISKALQHESAFIRKSVWQALVEKDREAIFDELERTCGTDS